jgi:hypothetical protein
MDDRARFTCRQSIAGTNEAGSGVKEFITFSFRFTANCVTIGFPFGWLSFGHVIALPTDHTLTCPT